MQDLILTRDQVREIDRRAVQEYGMSGLVLMENAGRGAAELLARLHIEGRVVICCGRGNNAGDGFVIARHLDLMGYETHIVMLAPPNALVGDAAVNCRIHQRAGLATTVLGATVLGATVLDATVLDATAAPRQLAQQLSNCDWVVDAILGTGARGGPRPPWDRYVHMLNDAPARKLAVDIPTGLDCDTGAISDPTFRADHTVTFVAHKPGLIKSPHIAGTVHRVGIGVPSQLVNEIATGDASQASRN